MGSKILEMVKKNREVIVYLIFGVLTTLVNYAVYLPCLNLLGMPAAAANILSWIVAVIFAFVTNKYYVFNSKDWALSVVMPELVKFMGTRVASGLLETGILLVTVDILKWNGNLWKLITSVLVVIVNYIGSKLLVFNEK